MNEIWKDIKGYEGLYQVSNLGQVKRIMFLNNKTYKQLERMLKHADNGHGYKIVGLSKNGRRKNFYVHRLVAQEFIENKYNKKYINHINYNRGDNNVNNLEWITVKDNINYSLCNRPKVIKTTKPYGKYIKIDKRYNTYNVVVPINGVRKFIGSYKDLNEAINKRNEYYRPLLNEIILKNKEE